jgi:hypothetical protein
VSRFGSSLQFQIDTHADVIAARNKYREALANARSARVGRKRRMQFQLQEALHELMATERRIKQDLEDKI